MRIIVCTFATLWVSVLTCHAAEILAFRADDPLIQTVGGNVTLLPDNAQGLNATPVVGALGPTLTSANVNGVIRPVLRFNGTNQELHSGAITVPAVGSLFAVVNNADVSPGDNRIVGWENASSSDDGVALIPAYPSSGGVLLGVARNNGIVGDIVGSPPVGANFEILSLTWGPAGVTLDRTPYSGVTAHVGTNISISAVSSAPGVTALTIGGTGLGGAEIGVGLFHGDLLELRAYNSQLSNNVRADVETQLFNHWFAAPEPASIVVCGLGMIGLFLVARRRQKTGRNYSL